MGLFAARIRFDGEPPPEGEILAELGRRIGRTDGVDSIERQDNEIKIGAMLGPVTFVYLLKILSERGGVLLHYGSGEPRDFALPSYVDTPWVWLGVATRFWIQCRFHFGLVATAWR